MSVWWDWSSVRSCKMPCIMQTKDRFCTVMGAGGGGGEVECLGRGGLRVARLEKRGQCGDQSWATVYSCQYQIGWCSLSAYDPRLQNFTRKPNVVYAAVSGAWSHPQHRLPPLCLAAAQHAPTTEQASRFSRRGSWQRHQMPPPETEPGLPGLARPVCQAGASQRAEPACAGQPA